ncbi:MAG TPA: hypothetical protein VFZ70_00140, partial [Euzebyales bacterium]
MRASAASRRAGTRVLARLLVLALVLATFALPGAAVAEPKHPDRAQPAHAAARASNGRADR